MNDLTRANLHETYMHAYTTGKARARVERAFVEWEHLRVMEAGLGGASVPLTTLRTRWSHEATATGTGESEEIDFNIALRQGIEIFAVYCILNHAAIIVTKASMKTLVDLDGPALAGNAISTQALYEARRVLESVIANFGTATDALTSGGAIIEVQQWTGFPIPILTARNPGIARISIESSGESLVGIQHRFVEINRNENLELFALGRA